MKKDLLETRPGSNVYPGSGNVLVDLGFPDAEEMTTKVRLAVEINNILAERKLTQKEAAGLLGVNQPKISALQRYRLDGFSIARLMQFATALDYNVVIELRPLRRSGEHSAGRSRPCCIVCERYLTWR